MFSMISLLMILPNSDNNTLLWGKMTCSFTQREDVKWTINYVCNKEGVQVESLSPYLAVSLSHDWPLREVVKVWMPEPGSI